MTRLAVHSVGDVGATMSGPGMRAFHLARELANDFDVTLFAPNDDIAAEANVHVTRSPAGHELGEALAAYDVVFAQRLPFETMRRLVRGRVPTVYDLYVPIVSETLGMLDVEFENAAADLFADWSMLAHRYALATGAAFVCASERQRDFLLGMLGAAKRLDLRTYRSDRTLRALIDVVPFGLPAEPPRATQPVLKGVHAGIDADDLVLLWAGGIWNWFDPSTVIRAVAQLRRSDVKLVFLGTKHPQVPEMERTREALELARELNVLDERVFFRDGWVPYDERGAFLAEADVGVSAHFDTLETRYAFRTRLLDHFWAGLPTVTTRGDVLGDLVEERELGRAVPAGDVDAWAAALADLVDDDDRRGRYSRNVEDVRSEYEWSRVAEPLRRLLAQAASAPAPRPTQRFASLEEALLRARISLRLRRRRRDG